MKLLDFIFAKHDAKVRQQERERLYNLANGDVRGCAGYDCEECDRMYLLDNLSQIMKDWEDD